MIIRTLDDLVGGDREVQADNWRSRRLLLARDGQRFSLHDTILYAGTSTTMEYKHHVEAVYCIEGAGELVDERTGEVHTLAPGTMYLLDQHDRHTVRAQQDLRMICVFDPPVTGRETHGPDGAYPLVTEPDAPSATDVDGEDDAAPAKAPA